MLDWLSLAFSEYAIRIRAQDLRPAPKPPISSPGRLGGGTLPDALTIILEGTPACRAGPKDKSIDPAGPKAPEMVQIEWLGRVRSTR